MITFASMLADAALLVNCSEPVATRRTVDVAVTPDSVRLFVGQTIRFGVTVVGLDDPTITFRSENSNVVTVDDDGTARGVAPGSTTIVVAVRDGSTALERRVLVPLRITAEALIVGLFPQYGYIGPGDTLALTFYATGSGMTNRDVFFRTYRPDVATVSADGGVVGVTAGSAVISAIAHRDTTLRATSVVVVRNR